MHACLLVQRKRKEDARLRMDSKDIQVPVEDLPGHGLAFWTHKCSEWSRDGCMLNHSGTVRLHGAPRGTQRHQRGLQRTAERPRAQQPQGGHHAHGEGAQEVHCEPVDLEGGRRCH